MSYQPSIIKQPSKSLLTSPSLQNIVVDLDSQQEESISGGEYFPAFIILLAHSSKTQPGKQGGYMTVLED